MLLVPDLSKNKAYIHFAVLVPLKQLIVIVRRAKLLNITQREDIEQSRMEITRAHLENNICRLVMPTQLYLLKTILSTMKRSQFCISDILMGDVL